MKQRKVIEQLFNNPDKKYMKFRVLTMQGWLEWPLSRADMSLSFSFLVPFDNICSRSTSGIPWGSLEATVLVKLPRITMPEKTMKTIENCYNKILMNGKCLTQSQYLQLNFHYSWPNYSNPKSIFKTKFKAFSLNVANTKMN